MRKVIILSLIIWFSISYNLLADTVTLNLSAVLDAYPMSQEGFWKDIFEEDVFVIYDIFKFSHTGSGEGMAYWEGFAISTSSDTTNYGASSSSDGWISHQFGCMAGGGLNERLEVDSGLPYLVGYWGFYGEKMDADYHSLRCDFTDGKLHRPLGVYICNHPWPYYGNPGGDGFARPLNREGDFFTLTAHGIDADGKETGTTVTLDLARFADGQLTQSSQWQYMDLTALGNVSGIYFTMSTSVADQFGPLTATYFCLDKLSVTEALILNPPANLHISDTTPVSLTLTWDSVEMEDVGYNIYINGLKYASTPDTTLLIEGLLSSTTYTIGVAIEVDGQQSSLVTIDVTTPSIPPADSIPSPSGLHVSDTTPTSLTLAWGKVDMEGVVYNVYVNEVKYASTPDTTLLIEGLLPNTTYTIGVASEVDGQQSSLVTIDITTPSISPADSIPSPSGLHISDTADESDAIYTLDGRKIGIGSLQKGQIYILRSNRQTRRFRLL